MSSVSLFDLPLLNRPRLLERFDLRFVARITTIQAGAGFGKTTLLDQALAQNQREPKGIDLLLQARPSHRFVEALSKELAHLVSAPSEAQVAEAVRDWIWQRAPEPVAIVIDDVHEIVDGSSAIDLLDEIARELPRNGHLVLCGRSIPEIALSHWRARGETLEISEGDLAFDTTEIEAFRSLRGLSEETEVSGMGWPALLELSARGHGGGAVDALLDEHLKDQDEERREALARLSRLERIDDQSVHLLTRSRRSARELTRTLPLVRHFDDGSVALHALWRPALKRLPGARDFEVLRAAAQRLREDDEIEAALEILIEIEDQEAVRALISDLAMQRARLFGSEALRSMISRLPDEVRTSRHGILLDGLITSRDDPERAHPIITRAVAMCREAGDRDAEVRGLVALGHIAYYMGEVGKLLELGAYGRELTEQGYPAALSLALVAEACGALVRTEPEEALKLLDRARSISTMEGVPDFMVAVLASIDAGHPERASAEVSRARSYVKPDTRGALEVAALGARWQAGNITTDDVEDLRPWLTTETNDSVHNLAVSLGLLAQISASLGSRPLAESFERECQPLLQRSYDGRAQLTLSLGRIALSLLGGNEDVAAEQAKALYEEHFPEARPNRHFLRGIVFIYWLVPESRKEIDALALNGCWTLGRALAHALVALREKGDPAPAASLDWSRTDLMVPFVVPPILTELRVGAMTGGAEPDFVPESQPSEVREWLRRIADRSSKPAQALAKQVLGTMPIEPSAAVELSVLGSLELRRNGVLVDDANWRRSRVRALLLYLIVHPGSRREEVCAALWPEHSQESATNNLRVNLHHLIRVLQPERKASEHSWFIRQQGERLWLVIDQYLRVDANDFCRACQAGWEAHAEGAPRKALAFFHSAVSLYAGDYCAEAEDTNWAAPERTRLQIEFNRALVRAEELLVAADDAAALHYLSQRLGRIESFSLETIRIRTQALRLEGDTETARRFLHDSLASLRASEIEPDQALLSLAQDILD